MSIGAKKTAFFVIFSLVFGVSAPALAAPEGTVQETRFFVQSNKGYWRKALGIRHEFSDGFTTESSGLQLHLARLMGVKVFEVQRLNILPDDAPVPNGRPEAGKPKPTPTPIPRPTPTAQVPWGVAMLTAGAGGGAGVDVAVLDTGILAGHPDLTRRITGCKDFSQRKAPVVDGKCDDENGHGTHVAGIIAADGGADGLGIFGVAPEANLWSYKVCGRSGTCWSDDIAVAIRTAADNGADIVNMSLGSDTASSLIEDAVIYAVNKGVLVVAAAGNDGPYPASIDYPGGFVQVVAVGALDVNRVIADWSSRGINSTTEPYVVQERDIELAAPGVNVESTFNNGGYAILSGTSMASPYVAGLAAVLWDASAEAPATAARDALHAASADLDPAGDDDASGWGLPLLK